MKTSPVTTETNCVICDGMTPKLCPQCGGSLKWVGRGPGWMNADQWDAVKAGDYYCTTCPPDPAVNVHYKYFDEADLVVVEPHHNED
jgi:hypothetical protein